MRSDRGLTLPAWVGSLASAIDAGVLVLASAGAVDFASTTALDLLGCADEDELASSWPDILAQLERALGRPLSEADQRTVDVELSIRGKSHRLRCRIQRSEAESCEAFIVLLRDLRAVEALGAELRLATRFINFSRLYMPLAHDLRGPLNAMGLHLELLKEAERADGGLDDEAQQSLVSIEKEFARFKHSFEVFLKAGRPPDDAARAFDMRELVHEVAEMIGPPARHQKVQVEVGLPNDAMPYEGRRARLKQALVSIAINALDAMPEGGRLGLQLERGSGNALEISVSDNGPGIAPDLVLKIWDIHFTTKAGSTGLGLYVARALVEEQGGTITVDHTNAQGTRIKIALPPAIA